MEWNVRVVLRSIQRFSHRIPSNLNFLEIIVVGNRGCTRERRKRVTVEAKKKKKKEQQKKTASKTCK